MPILAVCPYCREGKVRAPNHAVGLSATCPRCQSCFTIVASDEPKVPQAGPAMLRTSAAATTPAATMVADDEPASDAALMDAAMSEVTEAAPPPPMVVLPRARSLPMGTPSAPQPEFAFVLGLIAVIVAGVSLAVSQLPYGRIATTVLAAIGLVLGVVSLLLAERKYLVPALSSAANAITLLFAVALPSWLGLSTWIPKQDFEDPKLVKAVGYDGETPVPAEWVDISKASWQQDDVRVAVRSSTIAPLELTGLNNKKKWTKEKYLQIWIQVKNSGVARQIDFRGWNLVAAPNQPTPQLSDSTGNSVPLKIFEGEWQPGGKVKPKLLSPGTTAEQLLIFTLPDLKFDFLRLELPSAAFGGTEPVRLMIPRGSVLYRS